MMIGFTFFVGYSIIKKEYWRDIMAEIAEKNEFYLIQGDKIEPSKKTLVSAFTYNQEQFIIYKASSGVKYARIMDGKIFVPDPEGIYENVVARYLEALQKGKKLANYQEIKEQFIEESLISQRALAPKKEGDKSITNHPVSYYMLDGDKLEKYQGRAVRVGEDVYLAGVKFQTPNVPLEVMEQGKEKIMDYIKEHETDPICYFVNEPMKNIQYFKQGIKIECIRLKNPVLLIDSYNYEEEMSNLLLNNQFESKKEQRKEKIEPDNEAVLPSVETISNVNEEISLEEEKIIKDEDSSIILPETNFEKEATNSIKKEKENPLTTVLYILENNQLKKYTAQLELVNDKFTASHLNFIEEIEVENIEKARKYLATHETKDAYFVENGLQLQYTEDLKIVGDHIEKIRKKYDHFYYVTNQGISEYSAEILTQNGKEYYTNIVLQSNITLQDAGIKKNDKNAIEAYIRENDKDVLVYHGDSAMLEKTDSKIDKAQFSKIESREKVAKEKKGELSRIFIPYRNGDSVILEEAQAIVLSKQPFQFEIVDQKGRLDKKTFKTPEEEMQFYQNLRNQSGAENIYIINKKDTFTSLHDDVHNHFLQIEPRHVTAYEKIQYPNTFNEQELIEQRKKDLEKLNKLAQVFQKKFEPKPVLEPVKVEELQPSLDKPVIKEEVSITPSLVPEKVEELVVEELPTIGTKPVVITHDLSNQFLREHPDKTALYVQILDYENMGKSKEEIQTLLPELNKIKQVYGFTKENVEAKEHTKRR